MDEKQERIEHITSVLLADTMENYYGAMSLVTQLLDCLKVEMNLKGEDYGPGDGNIIQNCIFTHVTNDPIAARETEKQVRDLLNVAVEKIVETETDMGVRHEDDKLYDAAKRTLKMMFGETLVDPMQAGKFPRRIL